MKSVSLVVPSSLRDNANKLACALGHDKPPGNTYSIPLSATGSGTATHYGAHTWASDEFVSVINDAKRGVMPEGVDFSEYLTENQVRSTIGALENQVGDATSETWPILLARLGLQVINEE